MVYLLYFLGRLLKSFPLSGTDILLQSWRFLSLRLPPYPSPALTTSACVRPTVSGDPRRISLWVVDLPVEDSRGLLGCSTLLESGLRPRPPAFLLTDVDLEPSPVRKEDEDLYPEVAPP